MSLDTSKAVFVTGGSGYIGRNVVRAFVERGHHVKALARSVASADVVAKLGAEPAMGDLLDLEALAAGMSGCEYLIHAAADTDHGAPTAEQERANLEGTQNVYAAAERAGIKRALHLSTEAVLLTGQPLVDADESTPMPETPAGGYSKTKAESERIALSHSREGLDVIVMRPRFVWGRDDSTALPQLADAARTGKLSWIGGGRYRMSTTHIANVVHGIMLSLELGRGGEVYFVSDGEPVEFRDFITELLATRDVEAPSKQVPRWLVAAAVRMGDALGRITGGAIRGPMSWQEYAVLGVEVTLNIDKARRELGYVPVISREEGMAELRLDVA